LRRECFGFVSLKRLTLEEGKFKKKASVWVLEKCLSAFRDLLS
jgi:hypothetical protein